MNVALAVFGVVVLAGQSSLVDRIRSLAETESNAQQNIGLQVAVFRDGKPVVDFAVGNANLEHDLPMTTRSLAPIASVSKAFTGALVAQAIAKGELESSANVRSLVPEFGKEGSPDITLAQLAAHVSGIRGYLPNERRPEFFAPHFATAAESLSIFAKDDLVAKPGEAFRYSSYNYNLLAAALERKGGKPFSQLLSERLLEPLGLHRTRMDDITIPIKGRVENYTIYDQVSGEEGKVWRRVVNQDYSYNQGGGNLLSCAYDLASFGDKLLRSDGFDPKARALMTTPSFAPLSVWGMGLMVFERPEIGRYFYVTGGFLAAQASLYVYERSRCAVAIVSNSNGFGARSGNLIQRLPHQINAAVESGVVTNHFERR